MEEPNHYRRFNEAFAPRKTPNPPQGSTATAVAYCDAFKRKFSIEPYLDEQALASLNAMDRAIGPIAVEAVRHYLLMNNEWFATKGYDVATFKGNVNVVLASLGRAKKGGELCSEAPAVEVFLHYLFACKGVYEGCGLRRIGEETFSYGKEPSIVVAAHQIKEHMNTWNTECKTLGTAREIFMRWLETLYEEQQFTAEPEETYL